MAEVRLLGLGKSYGGTPVLDDFSLDLEDGELVVVVGPSGCGKSTLLRLLAGLESPTKGEIHIGAHRVDGVSAQHRDVAMVFQSYALYPHMSVRRNVEFPLHMRGVARTVRRAKAEEVGELLEIRELFERKPAALSGGQRQRVALARALVREPALFLLDEPLSNLDARLRTNVRRHIRTLQRRLGVTTLYVTHDQTEAMTLGHRIVLLDRGRVQMVAPPQEAYARPANVFVAGFLGSPAMNLLHATLRGETVQIGDQCLVLSDGVREALAVADGAIVVGIRAEAFCPSASGAGGGFRATLDLATNEPLGGESILRGDLGGQEVCARLEDSSNNPLERTAAPTVLAPPEALHFFRASDGVRIGP